MLMSCAKNRFGVSPPQRLSRIEVLQRCFPVVAWKKRSLSCVHRSHDAAAIRTGLPLLKKELQSHTWPRPSWACTPCYVLRYVIVHATVPLSSLHRAPCRTARLPTLWLPKRHLYSYSILQSQVSSEMPHHRSCQSSQAAQHRMQHCNETMHVCA